MASSSSGKFLASSKNIDTSEYLLLLSEDLRDQCFVFGCLFESSTC